MYINNVFQCKVISDLKKNELFKDLDLNWTSLYQKFKRLMDAAIAKSNTVNLSSLEEEPTELESMLLSMSEEIEELKNDAAEKVQKKARKKRESDEREKLQLAKNGRSRNDTSVLSEICLSDDDDNDQFAINQSSNVRPPASTQPSPLAGLFNISESLSKMVSPNASDVVEADHKKRLLDLDLKQKIDEHDFKSRSRSRFL